MKNNEALIALRCWIKEKDTPIIVIIAKDGRTLETIKHENIKTDEDINGFKNFKYNGITKYDISISEKEYNERFTKLAKLHGNI